eukprot:310664-Chlamydomonas_euryale.AAC.2
MPEPVRGRTGVLTPSAAPAPPTSCYHSAESEPLLKRLRPMQRDTSKGIAQLAPPPQQKQQLSKQALPQATALRADDEAAASSHRGTSSSQRSSHGRSLSYAAATQCNVVHGLLEAECRSGECVRQQLPPVAAAATAAAAAATRVATPRGGGELTPHRNTRASSCGSDSCSAHGAVECRAGAAAARDEAGNVTLDTPFKWSCATTSGMTVVSHCGDPQSTRRSGAGGEGEASGQVTAESRRHSSGEYALPACGRPVRVSGGGGAEMSHAAAAQSQEWPQTRPWCDVVQRGAPCGNHWATVSTWVARRKPTPRKPPPGLHQPHIPTTGMVLPPLWPPRIAQLPPVLRCEPPPWEPPPCEPAPSLSQSFGAAASAVPQGYTEHGASDDRACAEEWLQPGQYLDMLLRDGDAVSPYTECTQLPALEGDPVRRAGSPAPMAPAPECHHHPELLRQLGSVHAAMASGGLNDLYDDEPQDGHNDLRNVLCNLWDL